MEKVIFKDLGSIDYQKCWDYQEALLGELVDRKLLNRDLKKEGEETLSKQVHYLIFCEHPPVYTLGKSGKEDHLLLKQNDLESEGFAFYKINRGGDITYHGPGQLVGYPILDLECFFTDVHKYVRFLEKAVINVLATYGISGKRVDGFTGVWLEGQPKRKICAIGVHLKRWVTMHGFALNVNTQLSHFGNIIPCGIQDDDKTVTSISKELGRAVDMEEVKQRLKEAFSTLFEFEYAEQNEFIKER